MGTQICFTADDKLVTAIDSIAKKMERTRADTINFLVCTGVLQVSDDATATFTTQPSQFNVAPAPLPEKINEEALKKQWPKTLSDLLLAGDLNVKANIIQNKRRIFWIVKTINVQKNAVSYEAINEELDAVTITMEAEPVMQGSVMVGIISRAKEQPLINPKFNPIIVANNVMQVGGE